MRALILQAVDNYNRKFSWWVVTYALKWAVLILAFIAWSLVVYRAGGVKAEQRYEEWKARFADDYISQMEAAEKGMSPDPKVELHKQIANAYAHVVKGLEEYHYDFNQFVTLLWCMDARTRNPIYSENLLDVIQTAGQWPGYNPNNDISESDYKVADKALTIIESAEHPAVSNSFIHASFDRDGITLRDTYEITYRTHFWRYEGD
jgi:hypothetical protein